LQSFFHKYLTMNDNLILKIEKAAKIIKGADYTTVFTGAGVSVESGIPPFRGKDGLWSKYDPNCLDIDLFYKSPLETWETIRAIFYDFFGKARPNPAHQVIAEMEEDGLVKAVITQNIDNLHQEAGSKTVFEFHGTAHEMVCTKCRNKVLAASVNLKILPPKCSKCSGLLKPDFIFFGEGIPTLALKNSENAAQNSDVMIIIGTTGEVMPACQLPYIAKRAGATIIEINPESSNFTNQITDIFLQGKAGEIMAEMREKLKNNS
jgi:NAD-dependent deacetylase